MRNLLLLLLISPLFFLSSVTAAPRKVIPLTLIYVEGPDAVGVPLAEKIVKWAIPYINGPKSVRVVFNKTFWYGDNPSECDSLVWEDRVACKNFWVRRTSEHQKSGGIVIVIMKPIHADHLYFSGVANGTCTIGKRSAVSILTVRHTTPLDFLIAATGVVHEVGHLLGAFHDDTSCKAMNTDAFRCSAEKKDTVGYSSWSAALINQCVKRKLR